jgi:tetratricopeptide (TPR) repeat protein
MTHAIQQKKIKWSSTQLTESNDYVRVFIKAISEYLTLPERQEIYFISKFFVDATVEIKRGHFEYAQHLFQRGEKYMEKVDVASLSGKLLRNVYTRSKSLYYYRSDQYQKAISLVDEALTINIDLEKSGLRFLIFDRFSQLHNLSRIYFSLHQTDKGVDVINSIATTLMTGQSSEYMTDVEGFLDNLNVDGKTMRSSFLCLIITETLNNLFKLSVDETSDGAALFTSTFYAQLTDAVKGFHVLTDIDRQLQEWLQIIELYHRREFDLFQEKSIAYLTSGRAFYGKQPNSIMAGYLMKLTGPLTV